MQNRLSGMKTYLIGAMDRVADGGEGWRNELTPYLQKKGMFVFDPAHKPIVGIDEEIVHRHEINRLKSLGQYDNIRSLYGVDVRGVDLRFVDEASFLICYLNIADGPCGTYEEWFSANRSKKPILTVVEGGKIKTPNWLLLCQPHQFFFDNFEQLKTYIDYVDTHEGKVETYGRWRFFDWKRLVRETTALHGEF